jgi:quercetin dioxygenase-like cupin family protein
MKLLAATLLPSLAVAAIAAETDQSNASRVTVTRSGSQPAATGQAEYFTGAVRIDLQFQRNDPARVTGAIVTFEPAARTAWHTHPLGQTLIVTAGTGLVQQWGEKVQEIKQGDVVWIPPGIKHWHGATPSERMTHIAVQERTGGKNVEWLEKVSDEQYESKAPPMEVDKEKR